MYHILKHLAEHHEVTVAAFGYPDEKRELLEHFPELEGRVHFAGRPYRNWRTLKLAASLLSRQSHWSYTTMHSDMQNLLDRLVAENDFDIIHSEFPVMTNYRLDSDALRVMDAHNVEYDNFRRMAEGQSNLLRKLFLNLEYRKFKKEEIEAASRQDAIFVTSERDAELFDRDVPDVPKFQVPNGVDMDFFQPSGEEPEPLSLVYVGMMKYTPNRDAMNWFLDEIFPRIVEKVPGVKLTIVGSNPGEELFSRASDRVEVTGFVDDVRPYIDRASAYVVPLRMGGGTRLKIIEAMAMRKPVVTTSIGCEGLGLENRETALIADEAGVFAEKTIELMSNRKLAGQLTERAYERAAANFSWKVIGKDIEYGYNRITGNTISKNGTPQQHIKTEDLTNAKV